MTPVTDPVIEAAERECDRRQAFAVGTAFASAVGSRPTDTDSWSDGLL